MDRGRPPFSIHRPRCNVGAVERATRLVDRAAGLPDRGHRARRRGDDGRSAITDGKRLGCHRRGHRHCRSPGFHAASACGERRSLRSEDHRGGKLRDTCRRLCRDRRIRNRSERRSACRRAGATGFRCGICRVTRARRPRPGKTTRGPGDHRRSLRSNAGAAHGRWALPCNRGPGSMAGASFSISRASVRARVMRPRNWASLPR